MRKVFMRMNVKQKTIKRNVFYSRGMERFLCLVMCLCLGISGIAVAGSFFVRAATVSGNLLVNPTFAVDSEGWYATSGSPDILLEHLADGNGQDGDGYV